MFNHEDTVVLVDVCDGDPLTWIDNDAIFQPLDTQRRVAFNHGASDGSSIADI